MWILKVQIEEEVLGIDLEGRTLTYVGTDTSIEFLFRMLKIRFPEAMYSLGSMLDGSTMVPHSGDEFPYWFSNEGLTNKHHNMQFLSEREKREMDFRIQQQYELPTAGHSSEVEEPDETVLLKMDMDDEDIPI